VNGAWLRFVFRGQRIGKAGGEGAQRLVGALFSQKAEEQRPHVGKRGAALPAGYFLGQTAPGEYVDEHIGLAQLQRRRRPGQRKAHVEADVEKPAPEQPVREVVQPFEPE